MTLRGLKRVGVTYSVSGVMMCDYVRAFIRVYLIQSHHTYEIVANCSRNLT